MCNWLTCIPQDTVKSRYQTGEPLPPKPIAMTQSLTNAVEYTVFADHLTLPTIVTVEAYNRVVYITQLC